MRRLIHVRFAGEAGFSLIEVLVAASVGVIVLMALSQMFINNMNMSKHAETVGKVADFSQDLRSVMSIEDVCKGSLLSAGAMPTSAFRLANASSEVLGVNRLIVGTSSPQRSLAVRGETLKNANNLRVRDIRIQDFVNISPVAQPDTIFSANLVVDFAKVGETFGPQNFVRKFSMVLRTATTSGTAHITSCSLGTMEPGAADIAMICTMSGGTLNGTTCQYPPRAPASTGDCVQALGAGYTWNGATCAPPASALPAAPAPVAAAQPPITNVYAWGAAENIPSIRNRAAYDEYANSIPNCTEAEGVGCVPAGYTCKNPSQLRRDGSISTWDFRRCNGRVYVSDNPSGGGNY